MTRASNQAIRDVNGRLKVDRGSGNGRIPKSSKAPAGPKTSTRSADKQNRVISRVEDFLASQFLFPLSFLAVLAAHGCIYSGGQALNAWVPGSGSTEESDTDVYVPQQKTALQDVFHVLKFSGIRWDNFLIRKLEDLDRCLRVAIPGDLLQSLATVIKNETMRASKSYDEQLREYLLSRIREADITVSRVVKDFTRAFSRAVGHLCDGKSPEGISVSRIWVFDARHEELRSTWVDVGEDVCALTNSLLMVLEDEGRDRWGIFQIEKAMKALEKEIQFDPVVPQVFGLEKGVRTKSSETRINMQVLKQDWQNMGLELHMLHDYLSYVLGTKAQQGYLSGAQFLVRQALNFKTQEIVSPCGYGDALRVLRGTLPAGKRVEIIIDPIHRKHPVYTVLQFYATHVMCFVGGTLGAHLYYSTAKVMRSLKVDFSGDPRQKRAEAAIKNKYEPRGWSFEEMGEDGDRARNAYDRDSDVVSFRPLYVKALERVGKETSLPPEIENVFSKDERGLKTLSWTEKGGKIPKKDIRGMETRRNKASEPHALRGFADINTAELVDSDSDSSRTLVDSDGTESDSSDSSTLVEPKDNASEIRADSESKHFLNWIHEQLREHEQVIDWDDWKSNNTLHTTLDIFFAGLTSIGEMQAM